MNWLVQADCFLSLSNMRNAQIKHEPTTKNISNIA